VTCAAGSSSGAGCAVAEKTWNEPTAVEELESTSLLHDSPYSISKITGEMYCLYYAKQQNIDVIRVRFQNVYGPREILAAGQWRGTMNTIWRNVIPTFIFKALNNYDLEIFENSRASRDFIYVQDVATGVFQAATLGVSGKVYNLASGSETFISDLAELILAMTSSKSNIIKRDKRDWDNSGRRYGSTKKAAHELNFAANIKLTDGLGSTIKWTAENMQKIVGKIDKFGMENDFN
jgi:nucleoside-diphosphate-sugar epimerase